MIRGRLAELSTEALLQVAVQYGLELDPDLDREDVIEEIAEAIEESRSDRSSDHSPPIHVVQTKYENARDAFGAHVTADDLTLPGGVRANRIVVILRDPHWAFAFWDLSAAKRTEFEQASRFDGLHLRVLEVDDVSSEEIHIRESFEIPVQLHDESWYIYLPRAETSYRIQLIARNAHRRELLALSNAVYVPRPALPFRPEDMTPEQMAVLELCGLEQLEMVPFVARSEARPAAND